MIDTETFTPSERLILNHIPTRYQKDNSLQIHIPSARFKKHRIESTPKRTIIPTERPEVIPRNSEAVRGQQEAVKKKQVINTSQQYGEIGQLSNHIS